MTGIDDQSRASDDSSDRPLQAPYDQKMAQHSRDAEESRLQFTSTVSSFTGQIHEVYSDEAAVKMRLYGYR